MPVLVTWGDRDGCEVSDGPDAVLSLTDASTILNDAALMLSRAATARILCGQGVVCFMFLCM